MENRSINADILYIIPSLIPRYNRSPFLGLIAGCGIAFAFLQYFVEGLVLHKLMIKLDLANARLSELLQLQDSGQLDIKVALWVSLAIFAVGMGMSLPIIRLISRRPLAPVTLVVFLLLSALALSLHSPEDLITQIGRTVRYINSYLILPSLTFFVIRRIGLSKLIRIAVPIFFAGYLYCSISILLDLFGSKGIADVGFRYSVLLGSATAQAALFTGAFVIVFLLRGVPEYKALPKILRSSAELLTCTTAFSVIVLTGSRGPFAAIAVAALFYALIQAKRNFTFIGLCIALPIISLAAMMYDAPLTNYFSSREGLDISTGRTDIWLYALAQMRGIEDLLIGYTVEIAPHNTILGLLVEYGIIALLAFIVFHFVIFGQAIKCLRRAQSPEAREMVSRAVAVQVGVITYGMYENFFFLNNGLLMLIYYFLFGLYLLIPLGQNSGAYTRRVKW